MARPDGKKYAEVAERAQKDPEFARQIVEGDEYPAIKAAILADLAEDSEVQGFAFNFQTAATQPTSTQLLSNFGSINWTNLQSLQDRAAHW